jgi:hypothetical protein
MTNNRKYGGGIRRIFYYLGVSETHADIDRVFPAIPPKSI